MIRIGTPSEVCSTAESTAQRPPTAMATTIASSMISGPGPGTFNATSAPASAPSTICPSTPRLYTPARKATATASPSPTIGMARSKVSASPRPVSEPENIDEYAVKGLDPAMTMTIPPITSASTTEVATGPVSASASRLPRPFSRLRRAPVSSLDN